MMEVFVFEKEEKKMRKTRERGGSGGKIALF